jgi:hypothetical protein
LDLADSVQESATFKPTLVVKVDNQHNDDLCNSSPLCKQVEFYSNKNPRHHVNTICTMRNAIKEFLGNGKFHQLNEKSPLGEGSNFSFKYSIKIKIRQIGGDSDETESNEDRQWRFRLLNLKVMGVVLVLLLLLSACVHF